MKKYIVPVLSWLIVAWICKVFLFSLPYKFTGHPDTRHIFGTIGAWMSDTILPAFGDFFSRFGAIIVGSFELTVSLVLIAPALIWLLGAMGLANSEGKRPVFHRVGGLMASAVMAGAVFFHLFTPLGVEVLHEGKSDGGSLFYAALSILVLGMVLYFMNRARRY